MSHELPCHQKPRSPVEPSASRHQTPETPTGLPSIPPVSLSGKMTADGYQPENWQWFKVLTEPHSLGVTDSRGQVKAVERDPMTIPVETLRASGHGPRVAWRVISALGDEPIDPTIRRLTELRQHCLSCAENAAEVRRCPIIDCPLWPYRLGRNPHNPKRGKNPFADTP
jgi:hypothetical protein